MRTRKCGNTLMTSLATISSNGLDFCKVNGIQLLLRHDYRDRDINNFTKTYQTFYSMLLSIYSGEKGHIELIVLLK